MKVLRQSETNSRILKISDYIRFLIPTCVQSVSADLMCYYISDFICGSLDNCSLTVPCFSLIFYLSLRNFADVGVKKLLKPRLSIRRVAFKAYQAGISVSFFEL